MAHVADAQSSARDRRVEILVVGAGQTGLATAHHLRRAGLEPHSEFVVLDDSAAPGGAWQHRRPGLTVEHAWGIQPLPGMTLPDLAPDASACAAVPAYLAAYEAAFDLPVVRPVHVHSVNDADGGLLRVVTDSGAWLTRGLVSATGTWRKPFWPSCPGQSAFAGRQLHSRDYARAEDFAGQRVIVVGAGMAAVALLLEISEVATTTWVSRRPPVFVEPELDAVTASDQERLVTDLSRADAWSLAHASSLAHPSSLELQPGVPLSGRIRRGLADGTLQRWPMFERLVADGAVWSPVDAPPAPEHVRADVVLWATGFRPALDHLAPLHLRGRGGAIALDGPQVVADPRVQLVGYGPAVGDSTRAGRTAVRNLRRLVGF